MNLCVNCSIGTSFLESKEASSESHTGELIFQYVNSCIEKVGAQNIVQVVTDNASNNMAAKDMLYVLKPNIFWTSCATHTINFMLERYGKDEEVQEYNWSSKSSQKLLLSSFMHTIRHSL